MLQLTNNTPFEVEVLPLPDCGGVDTVFTILKATFAMSPQVSLTDEQLPVSLADEHYGEPASSSIRIASDLSLDKQGTDILLSGSAWAPREEPTWQMDVALSVGAVGKRLRVFGDRVWRSGAVGASIDWVAPFVRMPLVWERAFGGTDQTSKGPVAEPNNPVGIGFRARNGSELQLGAPLPNIEDPQSLITSPNDLPKPVGIAPIAPHWQPRKSYAGTYDEEWQSTRAPYLPTDFDVRFFQIATPDLVTSVPLTGGEAVDLHGFSPSGHLRFVLPKLHLEVTHRLDTGVEIRAGQLDAVILMPDELRFAMIWRAALTCDKRTLRVREVEPELVAA